MNTISHMSGIKWKTMGVQSGPPLRTQTLDHFNVPSQRVAAGQEMSIW